MECIIKCNALLEQVSSKSTITKTEVHHAGIPLVTHKKKAKKNNAMTRCSIMLSPSMPKHVPGSDHNTAVMIKPMDRSNADF